MPERTVNPQDSIDLVHLLSSYGETLGTLYVRAYVYDNTDTEISGSPFALSHVANNLYTKRNAFQVGDSGIYKIVYLIYTDAGYTTRSANHQEVVDVVNVKIQSTTGLGGYGSQRQSGGDILVDLDPLKIILKRMEEKLNKGIEEMKQLVDREIELEIPEQNLKPILDEISTMKDKLNFPGDQKVIGILNSIVQSNSANNKKIIDAIKKNRSTFIKNKFDKSIMKPLLQGMAETNIAVGREMKSLKIDLTKTIDMKNEEAANKFKEILGSRVDMLVTVMDDLNESVRRKLKFTLDGLKVLMFSGRQPKQNINISLKKDV